MNNTLKGLFFSIYGKGEEKQQKKPQNSHHGPMPHARQREVHVCAHEIAKCMGSTNK